MRLKGIFGTQNITLSVNIKLEVYYMTDTVSVTKVYEDTVVVVYKLTNLSDGTGESSVKKVDLSTLTAANGQTPSSLRVDRIDYDVTSMRVLLQWDRTSPGTIAVLQGFGHLCWKKVGGLVDTGTGDTGSILLTTAQQAAGDGYDITLTLRKIQ